MRFLNVHKTHEIGRNQVFFHSPIQKASVSHMQIIRNFINFQSTKFIEFMYIR